MKRDGKVGKRRSPVASNMEKFNRPATHVDKKKRSRRGYSKHKEGYHA